MPELPEVITIKDQLNNTIKGKTIAEISTTLKIKQVDINNSSKIMYRRITAVDHVGKTIQIKTDTKFSILIHLGMTGRLLFNTTDQYEKVKFIFQDNSYLVFSDIRKFGYFKIIEEDEVAISKTKIGPSALTINLINFRTQIQQRKTDIKTLILNQHIISGLGNVYATDALFLAKINPLQTAKTLNPNQITKLLDAIQEILKEGIRNKGISMNRYVDIYGQKGSQQNFFRVYKKANQPCIRCKTIIQTTKQKGRTTYFCPECQKIT